MQKYCPHFVVQWKILLLDYLFKRPVDKLNFLRENCTHQPNVHN